VPGVPPVGEVPTRRRGGRASTATTVPRPVKPFASAGDLAAKTENFGVLADGVYARTAEGDPNVGETLSVLADGVYARTAEGDPNVGDGPDILSGIRAVHGDREHEAPADGRRWVDLSGILRSPGRSDVRFRRRSQGSEPRGGGSGPRDAARRPQTRRRPLGDPERAPRAGGGPPRRRRAGDPRGVGPRGRHRPSTRRQLRRAARRHGGGHSSGGNRRAISSSTSSNGAMRATAVSSHAPRRTHRSPSSARHSRNRSAGSTSQRCLTRCSR
jgi:hypothetical protein